MALLLAGFLATDAGTSVPFTTAEQFADAVSPLAGLLVADGSALVASVHSTKGSCTQWFWMRLAA